MTSRAGTNYLPAPPSSYLSDHTSSREYLPQELSGNFLQNSNLFEASPGPVQYRSSSSLRHMAANSAESTSSRPSLQGRAQGSQGSSSPVPRRISPLPVEHVYCLISELTHSQTFNAYVRDIHGSQASKLFACKFSGCTHPTAFYTETEAIQHVHYTHLNFHNQTFVCVTCGVVFARKQDAVRHVKTMNDGKKFVCSGCQKSYSRKDYRDSHQERCLERNSTYTFRV
ncbi:hypothetical protein JB92DRAFT_3101665 [Gautieria morchelliformis]|nr:hypothetical protein JB92DRAFT_3101665 [Gautieria morchelliformis]